MYPAPFYLVFGFGATRGDGAGTYSQFGAWESQPMFLGTMRVPG